MHTQSTIPVSVTRTRGPDTYRPDPPAPWRCPYGCEPGRNESPRELSLSDLLAGSHTGLVPGDTYGAWTVTAVNWVKVSPADIRAESAINGKIPLYDLECACGTIANNRYTFGLRCVHCRTTENYTIPLFRLFAMVGDLIKTINSPNEFPGWPREIAVEIHYGYPYNSYSITTGHYITLEDGMVAL